MGSIKSMAASVTLLAVFTMPALASKAPWEEYDKLINKAETIGAHGPNLFGDEVNTQNGGLSFRVIDVSIPGNNALPVEIVRTFSTETIAGFSPGTLPDNNVLDSPFGDWDLDLPSISAVFPLSTGWINPVAGKASQRCSVANTAEARPPIVSVNATNFHGEESWHGTRINIPGLGSKALLVRATGIPQPAAGGAYWVTSDWTSVSCLSAIKNGSGQGFLATTADGTRYWFDWMARADETRLTKRDPVNAGYNHLERGRYGLFATRVEDRFGNAVVYTYTNTADTPIRPTRIESSDGRVITLGYIGSFISTVSAHGRTWGYAYSGSRLTTVTLPDTSTWSINLDGFKRLMIRYFRGEPGEPWRSCGNPGDIYPQSYAGSITHPSGAVGQFTLEPQRFGRQGIPSGNCAVGDPGDPNDDTEWYPSAWDAYSLMRKEVSGPGVPAAAWVYAYNGGNSTEVFGPGDYVKYTYGNTFQNNEGKLLSVQRGASATSILSTQASTYALALSGTPYITPIGESGQSRSDDFTEEYPRPLAASTTSQQGVSFTWQVNTGCEGVGILCFDDFARPTSIARSSSLGYARSEATTYYDDLPKWVLGQIQSVTCIAPATCKPAWAPDGIVMSESGFDPLARPTWSKSFGLLQQTLTYYSGTDATQFGTVATVKDGNNKVTTLSSWKRGIPQTIRHPATPDSPLGAIESAVVHDRGWITSTTDENGAAYTTHYGYDAMGRLASKTYPTGDSTAWNTTTSSFVPVASSEYGIPTDHWRSTVQTGTGVKTTYYDALWRPLITLTQDTNDSTTKSFTVNRYDALGRMVFTSYPVASLTSVNDALTGTATTYDALGRVRLIKQDSELGVLTTNTEYLSGFQTRVTDPKLHVTTTTYQVFDAPATEAPVSIASPGGVTTTIARDAFGKPLTVTRTGPGG